jgi:ubiquinone/menaquinone biosynthesis C-methylase UbiE
MEILNFHGERLDFNIVDLDDFIFHLSRYEFSSRFCSGKVLDLACGVGYGSLFLSINDAISEITACDISEEALSYGRKMFSNHKISFQNQTAIQIPFDDCSYDAYVSLETFEHIKDVDIYLSEAYRVLKKKGIFIVSVPNKKFYFDAGIKNEFHFNEMYFNQFYSKLIQFFPCVHMFYQYFPVEKVEGNFAKKNGTTPSIIRKCISNGIPEPLKDIYRKQRYKRTYMRNMKKSILNKYRQNFSKLISEHKHLFEDVYKVFPIQNQEHEKTMGNFIAVCDK